VISESQTTLTLFQFCLTLVLTCSQSKSRLVTKRKQNDITLLNTFLLIIIFTKTCIKALYMRHNYCLARKLCSIFLHKCINYGHVAQYAYAYRYLFTFAAAETAPETV